ncbi:hypothetical protein K490DRAFT_51613 [Saccharata proteae CBS 121410]|uniref:F-box domain-containing protein n=1 Tax=Saccharata proteae CBS 121410 TaxID=1314787 RepID=A0A9P4HKV5_9PEZI|nr:hypothetical protein K490DRAFT_51613 [Saccharata proteae CBS 121410]
MATLLDLSNELLQSVLVETEPKDLARLSQSCRALNRFIKNNRLLWKDVYLRNFDNPPTRDGQAELDWEVQLPRLMALKGLLQSSAVEEKRSKFDAIASAIFELLATSDPGLEYSRNIDFLNDLIDIKGRLGVNRPGTSSKTSQENADMLLCGSSLFKEAGSPSAHTPYNYPNQRQMSAKLHVYHGVHAEPCSFEAQLDGRPPIHCYARSRVYDLRRYTEHSLWGPFIDDGSQRVDWEKLESIMIVLCFNMDKFGRRISRSEELAKLAWHEPFAGAMQNSYKNKPLTTQDENGEWMMIPLTLEQRDPYGITGTWRRVVCFLDYNDLYFFNFESENPLPGNDRPPNSTAEAIRFITMRLRVKKIEPPGEDDGQAQPVVYFTGTSHSMHASWDPNANSKIRGTVRLSPEGEVRWTSFSIFHGEERWRSEGIQVGGMRSSRGVLGTWFDKDYDPNGPAGPTAFWKVSDDVAEDKGHLTDVPFF